MDPRIQSYQAKSRVQHPAYFLTMNCLLCSRVDMGQAAERDFYDEDVDAYIQHLLEALADPDTLHRARKFLSKYDAEVIKRLGRSREARLRYNIYRTESDLLLLSVGSFCSPPLRRGRGRHEPIEEGYIGRGKTYYHFAYSYSQRLHLRNTALGEVMEKLVVGFQRYAEVLSQMRGEDTNLLHQLLDGERTVLERVISKNRQEEILETKQDELLEAISDYQRTRSTASRLRITELVDEIGELKPGFSYDLERLERATDQDTEPAGDCEGRTDVTRHRDSQSGPDGYVDIHRIDAA